MTRLFFAAVVCVGVGITAYCAGEAAAQASRDWEYSKPEDGPAAMTLEYRGNELPKSVCREGTRLTTDIGTFYYGQDEKTKKAVGWWPLALDVPADIGAVDQGIEFPEATLGFYAAALKGKKAHTPVDWVYVEYNGVGYWADPARLDRLSEQFLPHADLREERFR